MFLAWGLPADLLLAAYAIAINIAYLLVKLSCLEAGCCKAKRRVPAPGWLHGDPDLRVVEILATAVILVGSLWFLFAGQHMEIAAISGLWGHLSVRLLSRWARRRLPEKWSDIGTSGLELIPLAMAALLALANAMPT